MKTIAGLVMAVVLVVASAGCNTVVRIPDGSDRGYTEISGDVPRFGELIRVREIVGHETNGPYVYDTTWSYYWEETGRHVCHSTWSQLPGVKEPGLYAVIRGGGKGKDLYLVETK